MVEGSLDDYLAVDDQLATGGMLNLIEIASDVSTNGVKEPFTDSDSEVVEIEEEEEPPITAREATAGFKLFQRYVEQNFNDPAVLQMCDKFDDILANERVHNMKQKSVLNYFSVNK